MRNERIKRLVGMGLAASIAVTSLIGCTNTEASNEPSKPKTEPTENDKNTDTKKDEDEKPSDNVETADKVIKFSGKTGQYDITQYAKETKGVVTNVSSWLNVREEPSLYSSIVDKVYNDNELVVIGYCGDWYQVKLQDKELFVHKNYLKVDGQAYNFDKAFDERYMNDDHSSNVSYKPSNSYSSSKKHQSSGNNYVAHNNNSSSNHSSNSNNSNNNNVVKPEVPPTIDTNPNVPVEPPVKPEVIPGMQLQPSIKHEIIPGMQLNPSIKNDVIPGLPLEPPTINKPADTINEAPIIEGKDIEIQMGTEFNISLLGLKAHDKEDGDITSSIEIVDNNVDTSVAGFYSVTVKVIDSKGATTIKTFKVNVKPVVKPGLAINHVPTITGKNITVEKDSKFDLSMLELKAEDAEDGVITDKIEEVTEKVDTSVLGNHNVTVRVSDKEGATTYATFTVSVAEGAIGGQTINHAPTISLKSDITVEQGQYNQDLLGITANDAEDGILTDKVKLVSGKVEADKVGDYELVFSVSDKEGATTIAKTTVHVIAKHVNSLPKFYGVKDITLTQGDTFDVNNLGITVKDEEDGNLEFTVDENPVDTETVGEYTVKLSAKDRDGGVATATFKVTVNPRIGAVIGAPTITVQNPTVELTQGDDWNLALHGVSAKNKDGEDITSEIKVDGSINTSSVGEQHVTISVTSAEGIIARKVLTVNVKAKPVENHAPVITAFNATIQQGMSFSNSTCRVQAIDPEEGDITDRVERIGEVNTKAPGVYPITFRVSDSQGASASIDVKVIVEAVKPRLNVQHKTITLDNGAKYDTALFGATATDANGMDITDRIKFTGDVKETVSGTYNVTASVTDDYGTSNSVELQVVVNYAEGMSVYSDEFRNIVTQEMYRLIDDARAERGVVKLRRNPLVEECANFKSKDMYDRNYFDHEYNGMAIWEEFPKYAPLCIAGENIYSGSIDEERLYTEQEAKDFSLKLFTTWQNSPMHNSTMMAKDATEMGFGFFITPVGGVLATQHFVFE